MAGKAALVDQIKGIQRSDPDAKQAWWDHCDNNLGGVKDPNRHDEGVLAEFLSMYNSGGFQATGARPAAGRAAPSRAANPGGAGGWGQQSYGHQPAAASWGAYAPTPAASTWAAPSAAASWGAGGGASSGSNLAELVKTGQRQSEAWKSAWKNYCALYGTGKFDPTKYDDDFIVGFVNYVGELATGELGAQAEERGLADGGAGVGMKRSAPSSAMGFPPAKRQAMGGGGSFTAWGAAGGDNGGKADLVNKVKALQRSDPDAKNAWWQFCNDSLGGVKDPSKHEAETLQQFLDSYS